MTNDEKNDTNALTENNRNVDNEDLLNINIDVTSLVENSEIYRESSENIFLSIRNILIDAHKYAESFTNAIMPIINVVKKISDYAEPIKEVIEAFGLLAVKVNAMKKLATIQLIWYDKIDSELALKINTEEDLNSLMSTYLEETNYQEVKRIIKLTRKNKLMDDKKELYSHSISSYNKQHYDLACIGFIAVIDFLMSKISGNLSPSGNNRIELILNKLNTQKTLSKLELSLLSTLISFDGVINSLFEFSEFANPEPVTLNRHWIAHGRTLKDYRKLDCVKLINIIYALLIIGSLQENETNEE
ncbi:MAG: hypothetical protein RR500_05715 [Bacilli bacterium]